MIVSNYKLARIREAAAINSLLLSGGTMFIRPKPPAVPQALLERFGNPEEVFGPNVKFRVVAAVCGLVVLAMGIVFLVMSLAGPAVKLPLSDWVSGKLSVGLIAIGVVVLIGTRMAPMNWVFICPRGLIRTRGMAWDGIAWDEVDRFEDAAIRTGSVTVRQCRIVTTSGAEWGFLADHVAHFGRLTDVLRQKSGMAHKPTPSKE